jgi:hypothetical protein
MVVADAEELTDVLVLIADPDAIADLDATIK